MTREKLTELKKLQDDLTAAEGMKRAFDNCANHGGDPRIAIRDLLKELSYHPSDKTLKAVCAIFSNDLDEKRAAAKVAFQVA